MKSNKTILTVMCALTIAFIIIGICLWAFVLKIGSDSILAIAFLLIALTTFYGFLRLSAPGETEWALTTEKLRNAIAASLIITYLVLMAIAVFFAHQTGELPAITRSMINSFTAIVGVVIAFYFGSSAYIQAKQEKRRKSAEDEERSDAAK